MKQSHRIIAALMAALLTPACLDLKPEAAPQVRWLDLNPAAEAVSPGDSPDGVPDGVSDRGLKRDSVSLGRVAASEAITERLMRRTAPHEVSYDDYSRWTEDPAAVTRRALEEALYRQRSLKRASTTRLQVELVRLEIESADTPTAVVALLVLTEDSEGVQLDRRFEGRAPVVDGGAAAEASAASKALASAVNEIADAVARR